MGPVGAIRGLPADDEEQDNPVGLSADSCEQEPRSENPTQSDLTRSLMGRVGVAGVCSRLLALLGD